MKVGRERYVQLFTVLHWLGVWRWENLIRHLHGTFVGLQYRLWLHQVHRVPLASVHRAVMYFFPEIVHHLVIP